MRFSRAALFLASPLLCAAGLLHAGDAGVHDIADQTIRLQEQKAEEGTPDWAVVDPERTRRYQQAIDEIFRGTSREMQARVPQSHQQSPFIKATGDAIELYVSFSLGEAALQQILVHAAGRDDVTLYLRGIPPGHDLGGLARRLHAIARGIDNPPQVLIDPSRFRDSGIRVAPEILLKRDGQIAARAAGLTGIERFLELAERRQEVDLGTHGPVEPIAERDLIEQMQARIARLDFEAMKEQAVRRFWDNVPISPLPTATQDRVRHIDPTVVVTQNLVDGDGNVIVAAGTRVNPLEQLPFSSRLIVFDSRDERQVLQALGWMRESSAHSTVLMVSDYDRSLSWDGWRELEERFNAPVYLLNDQVRSRFDLKVVPALIKAEGLGFVVTEIAPNDEANDG
jgi:conjugal transfer pilus assembly protein TraW